MNLGEEDRGHWEGENDRLLSSFLLTSIPPGSHLRDLPANHPSPLLGLLTVQAPWSSFLLRLGLPEGRSLILPAQNVFSSSDYCFLKPEPYLPPLTSDLPTLRFDLLPQTGDLPWPELGLLDLPRSSFILKEKQRHCTILSSSCHYATLPSSPLISGHLSA